MLFQCFVEFSDLIVNACCRWMSLGNQLSGARLVDEGLRARFKAAYPDVDVQPASPPRSSAMEVDSVGVQVRNAFGGGESIAQGGSYLSQEKPANVDIEMTG